MNIRKLMAVIAVIPLLAACDPTRGGPSNTRPDPQAAEWNQATNVPRLKICSNPRTVPKGQRWGKLPGQTHYLIIISADTLRTNGDCRPNSALPFTIKLDGWVNEQPGVKMELLGKPLPWEANLLTTHFEHIQVPDNVKFDHVTIQVHATPRVTAIDFRNLPPTKLRCTIFRDGERRNYSWREVVRLSPISPRCILRDSLV